jgi:hypothetical protein
MGTTPVNDPTGNPHGPVQNPPTPAAVPVEPVPEGDDESLDEAAEHYQKTHGWLP